MKPLWNVKVGNFVYRKNVSLPRASKIAHSLQKEVLDIKIERVTSTVEIRRMVSGI